MFQSTHPRGARRQIAASSATFPAFQSTRPRGARPRDCLPGSAGTPFQSTRPRGARHMGFSRSATHRSFNPRARVGRDEDLDLSRARRLAVSIHAPAWGATRRLVRVMWARPCFNPRARVGRDFAILKCDVAATEVSIHAPAWGATGAGGWLSAGANVSIHAPAWGATAGAIGQAHVMFVSIHAPAWGATCSIGSGARPTSCFNPRARVGRDVWVFPMMDRKLCFNPRARVGRDDRALFGLESKECFNPRARVGRDGLTTCYKETSPGFQSTRPRGARQPHHNSLRDKDFFRVTREPMLSLDPKGTGQVAATQKPMKSISC